MSIRKSIRANGSTTYHVDGFDVGIRGALAKFCYRFGTVAQLRVAATKALADVLVERRDPAAYDEAAA